MNDHRVIVVVGRPSGGTSMVAGALHHLGVDMGDIEGVEKLAKSAPTNKRMYCGFEDWNAIASLGKAQVMGVEDPLFLDMDNNMRGYLQHRLDNANGRRVGVKVPAFVMTSRCPSLTLWPMDVVHVDRDMDATFESDIKYRGYNYQRAQERGVFDLALRQFLKRITPVLTIRYEDALVSPFYTVTALVNVLGLEPTPAQRQSAIDFIDPVKCKLAESRIK